MKKYKVEWLQDDTYQVMETKDAELQTGDTSLVVAQRQEEVVYQGSISNCEAWIKLHEKGYM